MQRPDLAQKIAGHIAANWKGQTDLHAPQPFDYYPFEDLAYGFAGVGLTLIEVGDSEHLPLAENLICSADASTHQVLTPGPGWLTGHIGLAYALVQLFHHTEKLEYLDRALSFVATVRKTQYHRTPDFYQGISGAILGILRIHSQTQNPELIPVIKHFLESLLGSAKLDRRGIFWQNPCYLSNSPAGFAHGNAGIAYTLLEVSRYFGDEGCRNLALNALAALESQPVEVDQSRPISFREFHQLLFHPKDNSGVQTLLPYWENGWVGLGFTKLKAWELTGESSYRLELATLVGHLLKTNPEDSLQMNYLGNLGVAELFERMLNSGPNLNVASIKEWLDRLESGIEQQLDDLVSHPSNFSFLNGLAGLGYFLAKSSRDSLIAPESEPTSTRPAPLLPWREAKALIRESNQVPHPIFEAGFSKSVWQLPQPSETISEYNLGVVNRKIEYHHQCTLEDQIKQQFSRLIAADLSPQWKLALNPFCELQELTEDGPPTAILTDGSQSRLLRLNPLSDLILDAMDSAHSLEEIIAIIESEHSVNAEVRKKIEKQTAQLVKAGILQIAFDSAIKSRFDQALEYRPLSNLEVPSGITVVIPCYSESDLLQTLKSLVACQATEARVTVLVILNAATSSAPDAIAQNLLTYLEGLEWINSAAIPDWIEIDFLFFPSIPIKYAGVGCARRIGLDLALKMQEDINNSLGIITCLDADCEVDQNYFVAIEKHFKNHPECNSASIYFEYKFESLPATDRLATILFELNFRYNNTFVNLSGLDSSHHLFGYCLAFRASTYRRSGGMVMLKGMEDYTFGEKLKQIGGVRNITETTVFPSSRISFRNEVGSANILVYYKDYYADHPEYGLVNHPRALIDLQSFHAQLDECFHETGSPPHWPPLLQEYWLFHGIDFSLEKINSLLARHRNNFQEFHRACIDHFFPIIGSTVRGPHFFTFAQQNPDFGQTDLIKGSKLLLELLFKKNYATGSPEELLLAFRQMEKTGRTT